MKKLYSLTPQKWWICAIGINIIIIFCLLPWLPDQLPMQFGSDGTANWTLPKYLGVWLLPALSAFFAYYYHKSKAFDYQKLLMLVVLLLFNLCFLGFIAFLK